jgi:hypothetical protein
MWSSTFDQRLQSWHQLRSRCRDLELESALINIDDWWKKSPWSPYYLHWDDRITWPDPWQLLSDNIFCDLARGLGILYTIVLLQRPDIFDCYLIEHQNDNLVLVNNEKYILNSSSATIVNNNPNIEKPRRRLDIKEIKKQLI